MTTSARFPSAFFLTALFCVIAGLLSAGAGETAALSAEPSVTLKAPSMASLDRADFMVGGDAAFRVHGKAAGMGASQRVALMQQRLASIVGDTPIRPSDIAVYKPASGSPAIYVLGRRFWSIDAATAKAEGDSAAAVAIRWAKALQRDLPSTTGAAGGSEPAGNVPLRVTGDLAAVGDGTGEVKVKGVVVMRLRGVQPGPMTAADRASEVQSRLDSALRKTDEAKGPDIEVVILPVSDGGSVAPVILAVNGQRVMRIDRSLSASAGYASPDDLAQAWTKTIQTVEFGIPYAYTPIGSAPATRSLSAHRRKRPLHAKPSPASPNSNSLSPLPAPSFLSWMDPAVN